MFVTKLQVTITKLQADIQDRLRVREKELSKEKYCQQAGKALEDLRDVSAFNQNVSFPMGKAIQHLLNTIFVQMVNMTLF